MKLLSSIAISVAASAAIAAGVARYVEANAAVPSFWQRNPIAILWLAAGGPVVFALIVFAIAAFVLVTAGMLDDIGKGRARLVSDGRNGGPTAPDWVAVFAGTAFEPIADQLTADELRVAPLSLLRVLRIEVWRVYAKQLVSVEILVVAASAGVALVRPAWLSTPAPAVSSSWQLAAAMLLLAAVAAAWLLLDEAIGRMTRAITHATAAWPRPASIPEATFLLPPQRGTVEAAPRNDSLLAAVERLLDAMAGRPDPALRLASELALARAELRPLLERIDDRLQTPPAPQMIEGPREAVISEQALGDLTGALSEVARAVEKLSAESVAGRWDELEAAMRGIGATLDGIVEAMRAQPPRTAAPHTVTDKLEQLLEEISDRPV